MDKPEISFHFFTALHSGLPVGRQVEMKKDKLIQFIPQDSHKIPFSNRRPFGRVRIDKKIMIAYLSGLIIDKDEKTLTVLTNGIGYLVSGTSELISSTKTDHKIQLYIHTAVKEDDISLYGFLTKEERQFYQKLLTVSGIGPKMAMEILSSPMSLTKNAILSQDIGTLTKIKGLGKKTAERLCLELKNKIELQIDRGVSPENKAIHEDAVLALESLGYERYQILKSMAKLPTDIRETEDIVKYFLKST